MARYSVGLGGLSTREPHERVRAAERESNRTARSHNRFAAFRAALPLAHRVRRSLLINNGICPLACGRPRARVRRPCPALRESCVRTAP